MQSLTRLRSERYSSSSGHRLSGPLLQSYHGSPRHSFRTQKKSASPAAVLCRIVVLLLAVAGCWVGGKHMLHSKSLSAADRNAAFLASLGLGSAASPTQERSSMSSFWPPSDLGLMLPRPPWAKRDSEDDPESTKAVKGTRAGKWFGDEDPTWNTKEPSVEYNRQQRQPEAQPPPLAPSTALPNQQQEQEQAATTDTASDSEGSSRRPEADTASNDDSKASDADAAAMETPGGAQGDSEKEAEQLSSLSRVIQQQQETITKQASALQELQKRFDQQEHQLSAATATAAAANGSEGVQVEPYFPEEKVQQELTMLQKVQAQIAAVSKSIEEAHNALPSLTQEQQDVQQAEIRRAQQLLNRLSRVAAAINLRTSDPLTESGRDPLAELRHYYGTVASDVTLDWTEALSRQSRPSAEALGLTMDPFTDDMSDLDTLDLRLEYVGAMLQGMDDAAPCRLALATTWSGDLWGLRKELIPWLTYHSYLGVSRLYVLYEGTDMRTLRELMALKPLVTVILASAPLATVDEVASYEAWVNSVPDAHIREWKSQPGNYHLMTKQGYAVTTALDLAKKDNVTWLIHLDPDELLHPGASHAAGVLAGSYSLLPELCSTPKHVPSVRFVNVEGVPEAADLTNRYEQVTLFRSHRHLVPPAVQPFRYIFKQGHADAWLHLYTNGKSAVRPDAPGVTQGGPHVFLGPAHRRWITKDNIYGYWQPIISNSTLVLHYAYSTPGDVAVKAGRSCPPGVVDAVLAGNTSYASQCFVLDIDQRAFLAAAKDRNAAGLPPVPALPRADPAADKNSRLTTGPIVIDPAVYHGSNTSSGFSNESWPVGQHVMDFFWGELALSEGAPFECLTPDGKSTAWCAMRDVDKLKSLLISSGLMMRLHAPAQTMKGIETAIQQLMLIGHRKATNAAIPEIVVAAPAQAAEAAMAAAAAAAKAAAATGSYSDGTPAVAPVTTGPADAAAAAGQQDGAVGGLDIDRLEAQPMPTRQEKPLWEPAPLPPDQQWQKVEMPKLQRQPPSRERQPQPQPPAAPQRVWRPFPARPQQQQQQQERQQPQGQQQQQQVNAEPSPRAQPRDGIDWQLQQQLQDLKQQQQADPSRRQQDREQDQRPETPPGPRDGDTRKPPATDAAERRGDQRRADDRRPEQRTYDNDRDRRTEGQVRAGYEPGRQDHDGRMRAWFDRQERQRRERPSPSYVGQNQARREEPAGSYRGPRVNTEVYNPGRAPQRAAAAADSGSGDGAQQQSAFWESRGGQRDGARQEGTRQQGSDQQEYSAWDVEKRNSQKPAGQQAGNDGSRRPQATAAEAAPARKAAPEGSRVQQQQQQQQERRPQQQWQREPEPRQQRQLQQQREPEQQQRQPQQRSQQQESAASWEQPRSRGWQEVDVQPEQLRDPASTP